MRLVLTFPNNETKTWYILPEQLKLKLLLIKLNYNTEGCLLHAAGVNVTELLNK